MGIKYLFAPITTVLCFSLGLMCHRQACDDRPIYPLLMYMVQGEHQLIYQLLKCSRSYSKALCCSGLEEYLQAATRFH